jgi:hypothetical protein
MHGPEQPGKWSSLGATNCGKRHQFLQSGRRYRVIRKFIDYDKDVHLPGEEWVFLGYSFLPYEDGMSFFVSLDGVREWHVRLQWIPEEQGEILDNLADYITAVGPAS